MSIKINMKQVNFEAFIDEATTKKVEQIKRELLQQFKYELLAENATINLSIEQPAIFVCDQQIFLIN